MGEIHQPHDAEYQSDTKRDQRIERAQAERINDVLQEEGH